MSRTTGRYEVRPFPIERRPPVEMFRAMGRRNAMYGLFEADVTEARRRIREHGDRTGERLSFTAFIVACLARAVDENREVQAFRKGWRRLIVFDDVDVATMVEVDAGGVQVPLFHVVRDAARRSVLDIHEEIREAQRNKAGLDHRRRQIRPLMVLPKPVRLLLWKVVARSPRLWKKYGGTVNVTSVGMFGKGPGWGFARIAYPLGITVGGIGERPVLRDGKLELHEYLSLTVSFDHDTVDGAPAARFGSRLKELIEESFGLPEAVGRATPEPRSQPGRASRSGIGTTQVTHAGGSEEERQRK